MTVLVTLGCVFQSCHQVSFPISIGRFPSHRSSFRLPWLLETQPGEVFILASCVHYLAFVNTASFEISISCLLLLWSQQAGINYTMCLRNPLNLLVNSSQQLMEFTIKNVCNYLYSCYLPSNGTSKTSLIQISHCSLLQQLT